MRWVLTPLGDGEPVVLDKAILLFGRHTDCDVVLSRSRKVSRKHCCVAQIDDDIVVRDLGSMNGVRINGVLIDRESRLRPGDELWIGDVGFRLEAAKILQRSAPRTEIPRRESTWVPNPDANVRRVSADELSRDVPVAIPEGDADFLIEETFPLAGRPRKAKQRPRPPKPKPKPQRPDSDEVIVLGDDDIIG